MMAQQEMETINLGEWEWQQNCPCRFCHEQGHVYFMIDEGPEAVMGIPVARCDACYRTWSNDSRMA